MLGLSQRPQVPRRKRNRQQFHPSPERLSDRCLLSAISLTSATQANDQTVAVDYQVNVSNLNSLIIDIYRSTSAQLGVGNQAEIGTVALTGTELKAGGHDAVSLVLGDRSPDVDALAIDPAHPYVIAAATGPDGITSSASYQTITIGLVTHGFNPTDTAPAWIYQIAASLEGLGYDDAIAFNWAKASPALEAGEAVKSGIKAADMIEKYIDGKNGQGQPNVPARDVVDLQLIGHSRGSVVITQAMKTLQNNLAKIPQAKGGFWELTYLDPHPSHGTNVAPFSATSQYLLDAANALQRIYKDPYPLIVPTHVALAQIYYENTPVSMIVSTTEQGQVNPWGITYPTGIHSAPGGTTQFETLNLTTPGMTHSSVYEWYKANVVPTLGSANPFVTGPIDAPIEGNGESLTAMAGSRLSDRFANFYDDNPGATSDDYTATINWGDGTATTTGSVAGTPDLGYFVLATHTYASSGTYHDSVTIRHTAGSVATFAGTVVVS